MRYVIIGGSGFVGQELIRQLNSDNVVVLDIVPSEENVKYIKQDITKKIDFKFNNDDIVIHLAANQYHNVVPRKNRQQFFEKTNTFGTANILQKMLKDGVKNMVFFSTDMVYGKPNNIPVMVDHPLNPFGYYGISKKKAEDICREYRTKGMNITIFRPRMIIGKGRLGILTKLFKLMDLNLPVPMIGLGNNCYQMIAVKDCAQAIIKAIENNFPNKEYNLGSNNPPKVKELLKETAQNADSKSIIIPTWGKAVKLCLSSLGILGCEIMYKEQYMIADENYIIDISETEKDLDWKPLYNDADMLLQAYQEYKRIK